MKAQITKTQFINEYVQRRAFARDAKKAWLKTHRAIRCYCGGKDCRGWRIDYVGENMVPALPATLAEFLTTPNTMKIKILTPPNRVEFSYALPGGGNLVLQLTDDRMTTADVTVYATPTLITELDKHAIAYEVVKP